MSSANEEFCSDIENGAAEAASAIIPVKSKEIYGAAYKRFVEWCASKNTNSVCEKVLQSYFNDKGKTMKASTLWSMYSKLKAMIFLERNVDISKYTALIAFLKRKNVGHQAKKSDILSQNDFERIIIEGEDNHHLLNKVAFIIGVAGACRKIELLSMMTEHVVDNGKYLEIIIPDTKTYRSRGFVVVPGNINGMNLLDILRRYISLRPAKTPHNRFFLGYRNGKCTIQPVGVGVNTFASMPRKIASFLGLEHAERFTGHCFRRSSATILAEKGASLTTIKQAGGWISATVAEGYIQNTLASKRKIANQIFGSNNEAGRSKKSNSMQKGIRNVSIHEAASSNGSSEILVENIFTEPRSQQSTNVNSLLEADADILFDTNMNGIATVHRITASQIITESVSNADIFPPNSVATVSNAPIPAILNAHNNTLPANISASTFHGCNFYFTK